MLVAVILQLRVIVNSHELCLTKLELDKEFERERRFDAGSITVNLKCVWKTPVDLRNLPCFYSSFSGYILSKLLIWPGHAC